MPSLTKCLVMGPRVPRWIWQAAVFGHSSIPLAAKTVEELGTKTGAWTTDVSYDSPVIAAENLKKVRGFADKWFDTRTMGMRAE
jgi:hypothetical protein